MKIHEYQAKDPVWKVRNSHSRKGQVAFTV